MLNPLFPLEKIFLKKRELFCAKCVLVSVKGKEAFT